MPFGDARDFIDWAFGDKPKVQRERMTPDDFRELRRKAGALNG